MARAFRRLLEVYAELAMEKAGEAARLLNPLIGYANYIPQPTNKQKRILLPYEAYQEHEARANPQPDMHMHSPYRLRGRV